MSSSLETMSRVGEFISDHRGTMIGAIAVGAGVAMTIGESVVVNAHGDRSHRANGQAPWLRKFNDYVLSFVGMTAREWTSAHVNAVESGNEYEGLMHHGMTDANIFPATKIEEYLRATEADPEKYAGFPTLPENQLIPNLDPSAQFTREEVREIGSFGMGVLSSVMGEDYKPQTDFTREEAEQIMDTTHPRYWYDQTERHDPDEPYTQDEIAKILLADPYSPALEPLDDGINNGPRGTHKNNTLRFYVAADMYERHPEYQAPFIREIETVGFKSKKLPLAYIAGSIAAFAALDAASNGLTAESVATGAASGALFAGGIGMGLPGEGARWVNALGHAGVVDNFSRLVGLLRNKPHELVPTTDGKYMTTLENSSGFRKIIARLVDAVTYGEILGQERHHVEPQKRKYTGKDGAEALAESPSTTALQFMADRSLLGLKPGEGFGDGRRPDVANSIIENVIEPARVRTVYPNIYAKSQAAA